MDEPNIISHMLSEPAWYMQPETLQSIKNCPHTFYLFIYLLGKADGYLKTYGMSAGIQLLSKVGITAFNGNLCLDKTGQHRALLFYRDS